MDYFLWKLMPGIEIRTIFSNDICRHCLLLPCLDKQINWVNYDGELGGIYSCIDSDWNELTDRKRFVIPRAIEINKLPRNFTKRGMYER